MTFLEWIIIFGCIFLVGYVVGYVVATAKWYEP